MGGLEGENNFEETVLYFIWDVMLSLCVEGGGRGER
jgi:hypothetical protein